MIPRGGVTPCRGVISRGGVKLLGRFGIALVLPAINGEAGSEVGSDVGSAVPIGGGTLLGVYDGAAAFGGVSSLRDTEAEGKCQQ